MTPEELCERIGGDPFRLELMLLADAAYGWVERGDDGRYRLTKEANAEFGDALRGLSPSTTNER